MNRVCYTFDCSLIGSLVGIISQHSLQRACLVTIVAQSQTPVEWERLLRSDNCCGRAVGTDASLERTHHCYILSPVVFSCGVPERRVCSTRRVRGWLHVVATASVAGVGVTVLTAGEQDGAYCVAGDTCGDQFDSVPIDCFPGTQILRLRRRLSRNFLVAIGAFRSPSGTLREQAKIGLWRGQNLKFPVIPTGALSFSLAG